MCVCVCVCVRVCVCVCVCESKISIILKQKFLVKDRIAQEQQLPFSLDIASSREKV